MSLLYKRINFLQIKIIFNTFVSKVPILL